MSFPKTRLVIALATLLLGVVGAHEATAQGLTRLVNTDLRVDVHFDPSTGVYTYNYTVVSGAENQGTIHMLSIALDTQSSVSSAPDPALTSDASFTRGNNAPTRTVPVGIRSPAGWKAGIGMTGWVGWGSSYRGIPVAPGTSLGDFVLTSKAPPGPRPFEIVPVLPLNDPTVYPDDCEAREDCLDAESFNVVGQTIGPVLASERVVMDGRGQRPFDVNRFLKYANPTTVSTTLPAGVRRFDLVVLYAAGVVPGTFTAELNGVPITPKFAPTPGGVDVVRLDLQLGSNTLILSVSGIRNDGNQGTDIDRLTFSVPTQ